MIKPKDRHYRSIKKFSKNEISVKLGTAMKFSTKRR